MMRLPKYSMVLELFIRYFILNTVAPEVETH